MSRIFNYMQTMSTLYIGNGIKEDEESVAFLKRYFGHIDAVKNIKEGVHQYESYHEKKKAFYDFVFMPASSIQQEGTFLSEHIDALNDKQMIIGIIQMHELEDLSSFIVAGMTHFIIAPLKEKQFEKTLTPLVSSLQTERKVIQMKEDISQIEQKLEYLEKTTQQKSSFLATISHEVRTPLNAIVGFVSLLYNQETNEEKRHRLNIIKDASHSLLKVVSDILDIIKIENEKLEVECISFDLHDELKYMNDFFSRKAQDKGVEFRLFYPCGLPARLKGDFHKTKQVMANLVENAIRFTPDGSMIKCSVWYKEGMLHMRIKDYGIGIVEEKHQYIFKAFHQADNVMAKEYGDTGLNLALSAELVKLMGGNIGFKSHKNGSIFYFNVPMEKTTHDQKVLTKKPQEPISELSGHLLIVDDIEANRMFLSVLLDNLKLSYDVAIDGLDALEKYKNNRYDLILMDEQMPQMNGTAVAREIRKIEQSKYLGHTPIVSLSASDSQSDRDYFLTMGMDDTLSKPLHPKQLQETLSRFLTS